MIYSVGENIYNLNSGIEFAQTSRTKFLSSGGIDTKLVLKKYNPLLANEIQKMGIPQNKYINMYDFFQGVTSVERIEKNHRLLEALDLREYHLTLVSSSYSLLENDSRSLAKVNIMPGTRGLIGSLDFTDKFHNPIISKKWDWRGFMSMEERYHSNGDIGQQIYFNLDGIPVIEIIYMCINNIAQPTLWTLKNYKGKDISFKTEDKLFGFFLNELNSIQKGTFIVDRPNLVGSVTAVNDPNSIVVYLHQDHLLPRQGKVLQISSTYNQLLKNETGKINAFVVATQEQANMLGSDTDVPALVLPTAYYDVVERKQTPTLTNLVYIGRLHRDKNITDLVTTLSYVRTAYPEAQLKLKGYFETAEYEQEVKDKVTELGLTDAVTFIPYSIDNSDIYTDASMFVTTSLSEGFGINALESLANGVPVACYDIPYIAGNLVVDGVNGVYTDVTTPNMLSQKIIAAFKDPELITSFQESARDTATEYTATSLGEQWQAAFDVKATV